MKIEIPRQIGEFLWTRYLPESTYKTFVLIGYLDREDVQVSDYKKELMESNLGESKTFDRVAEEKKKVLESLGLKYPESREDDLELLKTFGLIEEVEVAGEKRYKFSLEIKRPEEVLNLSDEEKTALENIKFEMAHDNAINMVLSLVLTNGKILDCTVEHIINMTRVKIADIRTVLDFLVNNEGSLNVQIQGGKSISKLKKSDRVRITVNDDVFNEKRFVL